MRVYTIEDLESFERDSFGRLICPSGDYTQIKSFGRWCRFGTIDEFEQKVNETHKHNEQYRKEYLLAIEYVKAVM